MGVALLTIRAWCEESPYLANSRSASPRGGCLCHVEVTVDRAGWHLALIHVMPTNDCQGDQ
jgi:hypothetical protein